MRRKWGELPFNVTRLGLDPKEERVSRFWGLEILPQNEKCLPLFDELLCCSFLGQQILSVSVLFFVSNFIASLGIWFLWGLENCVFFGLVLKRVQILSYFLSVVSGQHISDLNVFSKLGNYKATLESLTAFATFMSPSSPLPKEPRQKQTS